MRILNDPEFQALQRERAVFGWLCTAICVTTFFCFVFLLAFAPGVLAVPISDKSVISIGIPAAAGIMTMTLILIGVFTVRANRVYDKRLEKLLEALGDE